MMKTPPLRAAISQRVFWPVLSNEKTFQDLLRLANEHRPAVDEFLFFTEGDGQDFRYIPIDEVERRSSIMSARVREARSAGFKVTINVLNTVGHSDYAEPFRYPLPWSGVVGPDGVESTCCSCPRQPDFRTYVRAKYEAYAQCGPDWIWIDDDVRLFGHFWKVLNGCFCPVCLSEFSTRVGHAWEREPLYAALVKNTYPEVNPVRAQWMKFLSDQIVEVHQLIHDSVQAVDPAIGLGAMNTCFRWFSASSAGTMELLSSCSPKPKRRVGPGKERLSR